MSDLENQGKHVVIDTAYHGAAGLTVFPSMLLHFDVGRAVSIQALDQAVELGSYIFLVPQKELAVEDPELK